MLAAVSVNGIVSISNILTQSQMIVGELAVGETTAIGYTADDCLLLKTSGKAFKWPTISYDKCIEVDAGTEPLALPQIENCNDPASDLYKMLKDSDMLGAKTIISEDRSLIAVGYRSGYIQIWSTREQTVIAELTLGDGQVTTASFSPNGENAAVGAGGQLVHRWSIKEGKCRGILHFDKPILKVRFPATTDFSKSPYLECEYSNGHCFRLNIFTGKFSEYINNQRILKTQKAIRSRLRHEHIKKIEVASNDNAVVLLNNSSMLYVWDNATRALNLCNGHTSKILDAAICTADPRYAASYSDERICVKGKDPNHLNGKKVIRAWAIRKGNCMQRLSTGQRTIKRIQFFTTNRVILAGFATNGDIMLWELINKMVQGKEHGHWNLIDTVCNVSAEPMECAVSTSDKLFIGVNADGTMFSRTFSGVVKKEIRIFPGIDLTPLRWDVLDCTDELKNILQNYRV